MADLLAQLQGAAQAVKRRPGGAQSSMASLVERTGFLVEHSLLALHLAGAPSAGLARQPRLNEELLDLLGAVVNGDRVGIPDRIEAISHDQRFAACFESGPEGARGAETLVSAMAFQRRWNSNALSALVLSTAWPDGGPGAAHARLASIQSPPVVLDAGRSVFAKIRHLPTDSGLRVLARQSAFNRVFEQTLRRHLGLGFPTPADRRELDRRLRDEEAGDVAATAVRLEATSFRPTVSVVMPTFETPVAFLQAAIDSVLDQSYPHWELCIVDDGSRSVGVRKMLEEYAARDQRVVVRFSEVNQGIAAATDSAIGLGTGELVSFLDHDDVLSPHALAAAVVRFDDRPDVDVVYSDQDRIAADGSRVHPLRKPDWSPDLLRACAYWQHFVVVRRRCLLEVGGLGRGHDGAQDWDLWLRLADHGCRIDHCAQILYHWRESPSSLASGVGAKPLAVDAGGRALVAHFRRTGVRGRAAYHPPTHWQTVYEVDDRARASIVVAGQNSVADLHTLLTSLNRAVSEGAEVVVVGPGGGFEWPPHWDPAARRAVEWTGPAQPAAMLNAGAAAATGDVLVFLHDDCEAYGEWLAELTGQALRPEVGVVGGVLWYPDRTIQSAGIAIRPTGAFTHQFAHWPDANVWTVYGSIQWPRDVSAVSGACMAMRRQVFKDLGGFDPSLQVGHDVELCLRAGRSGLRNVVTSHAGMTHHHACAEAVAEREEMPGVATVLVKLTGGGEPYFDQRYQDQVDAGVSP